MGAQSGVQAADVEGSDRFSDCFYALYGPAFDPSGG